MLKYLWLALMINSSWGIATPPPACFPILEYIQHEMPLCGVLKKSEDFVYVDVDDCYIHKLVTFIEKEGFEEPPYFEGGVGAHITVMYSDEVKKYGIKDIQECGEIIYFSVKECKVVTPPRWEEIEEVYFVTVEAPELDCIRKKYGLPKREYDFHITIGVKPKKLKAA